MPTLLKESRARSVFSYLLDLYIYKEIDISLAKVQEVGSPVLVGKVIISMALLLDFWFYLIVLF